MAISPRPQVELEKTYNAAADHYDHPPVSFWDRYGRRTVDRLPLISGMAVLDVCCGMGASAIPAAERVGPAGKVIAVDLAEKLLSKGSQRATEQGLTNIEFRRADLQSLPFPDRTFEPVTGIAILERLSDSEKKQLQKRLSINVLVDAFVVDAFAPLRDTLVGLESFTGDDGKRFWIYPKKILDF
jgi:ubiquinone/menaquinone biosynthesis C-methylase UbiE